MNKCIQDQGHPALRCLSEEEKWHPEEDVSQKVKDESSRQIV
jgi:hypothetical protein